MTHTGEKSDGTFLTWGVASPWSSASAGLRPLVGLAGVASAPVLPAPPLGEEIFGPRGPLAVPFPWASTILTWAAVIVGALALYRLGVWLLTAGPRSRLGPRPVDHRKAALAALDRLRRSPLWAEDRAKDICEHLARILKDFLKDQFQIGFGAAATTDECLSYLERHRVAPRLQDATADLFRLFDTVKFARGSLGARTPQELHDRIRELLLQEGWLS